ncbi:S8 family serine peptidase [Lysobacter sp. GX 14042]|uniref:autotransporter serine protease n=1 Tax=Lysobacter sp. GX 14042 TaxID=2907155 RepID=UPI001F47EC02|nr:autotransporter serine protease [Lysobacter sp. GX 14042]MCE7032861.1 S8 family serine peptidase [Lysobacter sp. GX 14042]
MNSQHPVRLRPARLAFAIAALVALSACGGGGSGHQIKDPPPAPPDPPPSSNYPEPAVDAHLALTHAYEAHDAGYTGAGVTIGFLDSGIRRDHPTMTGKVSASYTYLDPVYNDLESDDVLGHGTAVAQIAGGRPFGELPGGIAQGAKFVSARIISDAPPDDDGSGRGNEVRDGSWLSIPHEDLIDSGAKISNNSWGGLYWTGGDAVTRTFVDAMRPFVVDWGGLVVFAAGNEGLDHPSDTAALPALGAGAEVLERGWLAVGAVKSHKPDELADYSNACGRAMDFCLVAPGGVIVSDVDDERDDPSYWIYRGTSFAAPQVSGAAALVWEAFPYFDNDLVRQTLLGTATDLGKPGVDEIFGHGLLDVGRAVQGPGRLDWGQFRVAFSGGTSTWSNDISGSGGITKTGSGHLDLTGENRYTGTTVVTGGSLSSLHDLPGEVHIGEHGLVLLDGISVGGSVENAGILALIGTDPEGTDHLVAGDFTQADGGTLAFDIGERLDVAGTATLAGDALVTGITEGYVQSGRETFLHASNGVDGRFDGLFAGEGVFLDASLGYGSNTVWLDIERLDVSATAQGLGMPTAALSAAERVEQAFRLIDRGALPGMGDGPGTAGFLEAAGALQRSATAAAAQESLASLSGELHGAETAFTMMALEGGRHALENRLDRMGRGGPAGAWAERLGSERGMGSNAGQLDSDGWMIGHDLRVAPNLTVGAAFGQSDGFARHSLRRDRERNRQLDAQLYASWDSLAGSYLMGRLSHGRMDRDLQRDVLLGSDRFGVHAGYATTHTTVGLQAGHRFRLAGGTLTPYVGAQSLELSRDGFTEHGAAGFGLSTTGSSFNADQALAGVRLDRATWWGNARVDLTGRLEWQHTLSQSGQGIAARFTGIDAWSPISGAGLDDDVGVLGLGLGADLPVGRLGFELDARREFGETWTGADANWSVGF